MSGGGSTHWCYQCRRPVCPRSRGMVCPQCNWGFVQDLEELSGQYNNPYGYRVRDSPQELLGIMEAFDSLMLHNNLGHRFRPIDAFTNQRRRYGMENERRFEMFFNGHPGLQESIEQVMNQRQGSPPPAPRSAIEAMPTVKITQAHLQRDTHCPVCKDRFDLGMEARQMPCNHIYHSDCIVPWLVQHNSCPVCRHVLDSTPNSEQTPSRRITSSRNSQNPGRRNPFSNTWPFQQHPRTN